MILDWQAIVKDRFNDNHVFSIAGNQDIYFLPEDGEDIFKGMKPLIEESQEVFTVQMNIAIIRAFIEMRRFNIITQIGRSK